MLPAKNNFQLKLLSYPLDDELTVKIAMGLVGDPFSSPAPYKIGILADNY